MLRRTSPPSLVRETSRNCLHLRMCSRRGWIAHNGNLHRPCCQRTDISVSCINRAALSVLVCGALAACTDDGGRLSVDEGLKCATEGFRDHPGIFKARENVIAYSYETPNGPARVVVVFDERRRPITTFFESAPHGSHQELKEAAALIKDCVAYGPKEGGGRATTMKAAQA